MFRRAFALSALLVPTALADLCSVSGTTTMSSNSAIFTSLPCKTFTGSITVATDAVEAFSLHGVEEIRGGLVIDGVLGLSTVDLGDLRRVDQFKISSSNLASMTYPNLQTVKELEWAFMPPFEIANGLKIKDVQRLSISHTAIEDLSDVFDPEMMDYVLVANNPQMTNVTLSNLKTIGNALEIYDNAHHGSISFPQLEWTESLLITRVGYSSELDGQFVVVDLPSLEEVRGHLTIRNSPKIGKVDAPALVRVRGDLKVEGNSALVDMPFENLKSVGGDLIYTGNFTRLANKVEHTIGMVRYETSGDFDCRLYSGSTYNYEGGYYCKSASSSYGTDNLIGSAPSATTPIPTPTPTPTPSSKNEKTSSVGLAWWELFIICFTLACFVCFAVWWERRKKKLKRAQKVAIPVVNRFPRVRVSAPRHAPVVEHSTDNEILPPPVNAMVPPPRYSDEFGRGVEKTTLERGYRNRE